MDYYESLTKPLENISPEEVNHVIELAKSHLTNKLDIIVDLGCGTGYSTYLLQQALPDATVIGMDMNSLAIDIAKKAYPDIEWVNFNFTYKLGGFIEKYSPIDLSFALSVATKSAKDWLGLINQPIKVAYKLSGNLILMYSSPWGAYYKSRIAQTDPMTKWINLHPEGLINANRYCPIYVEYDRWRLYMVFSLIHVKEKVRTLEVERLLSEL